MPRSPKAGERPVSFSNPDKVYFPDGFTKGEMIRYYLDVAPYILPHLEARPVTLIRFPDGVRGGSFYEENAPSHAAQCITTDEVPRRHDEGDTGYTGTNDAETLAGCANLAAIELHPVVHRVPTIDTPADVAFGPDPGDGSDIFPCIDVALLQ